MKQHPAMLRRAEITPARYAELRKICEQYRDMRVAVMLAKRYGHHRYITDGDAEDMPEARRVMIIEKAAEAAGGKAVAEAVLKSVTEGARYYKLRPPCGERLFNKMRLRFYVELDKRLWEYERGKGK